MFGLTQDQLMGIGGLLGGFGQGMQQGGWSGGFAGGQQGLLNAQQMMQAQEMMKLRKAAAAMQTQEFDLKKADLARQQQTRDAYRTMIQGGPVSTGGAGGDQVAMQPGLLETANVSPMMRGLLMADPEKFAPLMGQAELTADAEKRKLQQQLGMKLWEQQNITIPTEERKAQLAKDQAQFTSGLSFNNEARLIPMRAAASADNRKPITLRLKDGSMASFMPGDPRVKASLDEGAVPVNLSVQSPTIEGMGIGKTGQNALDEGLIKAADGLAKIGQIRQSFRPEFQTALTRAGASWTALKDKASIPGWEPSPEDKAFLSEYTAFKRDAWENANATIQAITGAAMTNAETPRLMRQMPDPGTTWIDGDSPTEFQSKLAGVEKSLRQVFARYSYAKKNGLNWQFIPLDNVPKLMAEREKQLVGTIRMKRPDLAPDSPEFRDAVKRELAAEFGLPVQ